MLFLTDGAIIHHSPYTSFNSRNYLMFLFLLTSGNCCSFLTHVRMHVYVCMCVWRLSFWRKKSRQTAVGQKVLDMWTPAVHVSRKLLAINQPAARVTCDVLFKRRRDGKIIYVGKRKVLYFRNIQ